MKNKDRILKLLTGLHCLDNDLSKNTTLLF